jgi:hypothetical protein
LNIRADHIKAKTSLLEYENSNSSLLYFDLARHLLRALAWRRLPRTDGVKEIDDVRSGIGDDRKMGGAGVGFEVDRVAGGAEGFHVLLGAGDGDDVIGVTVADEDGRLRRLGAGGVLVDQGRLGFDRVRFDQCLWSIEQRGYAYPENAETVDIGFHHGATLPVPSSSRSTMPIENHCRFIRFLPSPQPAEE